MEVDTTGIKGKAVTSPCALRLVATEAPVPKLADIDTVGNDDVLDDLDV